MANHPSNFERMIVNNGPVQESIIQHLTHWEFRNLQLAGIRILVSREFRRKYHQPSRCNERDPERPSERCANTTESFDEIRACAGYPKFTLDASPGTLWSQTMESCLQDPQLSNPDDEPNIEKHPVHSKICRRCWDIIYAERQKRSLFMVEWFPHPLCKRHSLQQTNQLPLNACQCLDFMTDKWRCRKCAVGTFDYLQSRAYRASRCRYKANVAIPWSEPRALLAYLKVRFACWILGRSFFKKCWLGNYCPIEGCFRDPWYDENRSERMQLCVGCNAITRI